MGVVRDFGGYYTIGYQSKWRFCIPKERNFTAANLDILLRAEKLFFFHEIIGIELSSS